MKTLFIFITLLLAALNASSSFANISAKNLSRNIAPIQSTKFISFFNIVERGFFLSIDTSTPKENIPEHKALTPQKALPLKPIIPAQRQEIWIFNKDWVSAPARKANSFITLD